LVHLSDSGHPHEPVGGSDDAHSCSCTYDGGPPRQTGVTACARALTSAAQTATSGE